VLQPFPQPLHTFLLGERTLPISCCVRICSR
jgi:hypothetical protein